MDKREKVIKGLECCTFILGKRKCDKCPYAKGPDCYSLMPDAKALLKMQEQRVMTLDEYKAIAERPVEGRVPVWLEWRGGSGRWAIPERAYQGYGVNWRCWTGKPGEEEREAVKWE